MRAARTMHIRSFNQARDSRCDVPLESRLDALMNIKEMSQWIQATRVGEVEDRSWRER